MMISSKNFSALVNKLWADDDHFKTNEARVKNRDDLVPQIAELVMQKSTQEWITLLEQHNVPCGPVNNLEQILSDPQIKHRNMVRTIKNDDGTSVPVIANPINYSKTPMVIKRHRQN